ncbi:MAG: DUF1385 domain-containing protein [bacterium LCO1.1]|uniref:DUF1385 domain-containing protein n=1 Tax=Candidatus Weimeria bifida TaxID=2599074 RepID=A0A6N7J0X3_9FIRM|nr:DUF1385 domain-containing protein [Candidatus Weimeria bifida]
MAYSGIGGQAVMEGVEMLNGTKGAVAVRLTDGSIHTDTMDINPVPDWVKHTPVVRGVYSFFHSLVVGISSLYKSTSYFEDEDEKQKAEENPAKEKAEMGVSLVISFVLALAIFLYLPMFLSGFVNHFTKAAWVSVLFEGILRIVIFLLYIYFIGLTPDIKRTFMYHGAEHKCINCVEHDLPLTVENVRSSSRFHKRCGTSFIFIVFLISVFLFMFIRTDNMALKILFRLLLMPVIAGISFEFLRLGGRRENRLVNALAKPGLWVQRLTTKEPDDSMIEVGIASVRAVFDPDKFIQDHELQQ